MKEALKHAALFSLAWIVAISIYVILQKVSDFTYLWQIYLVPALFFGIIGFTASVLGRKHPPRTGSWWIWVLPAVITDQVIKLILFSMDWQALSIALIPPVFHLEPVHNTLGSYLWVLIDWQGANNKLNAVIAVVVGLLLTEIWRFYLHKERSSVWINGFFFLVASGVLCNVIDNLFHGGSLDFITVSPFYVSDLKDIFLVTGMMFMLVEYIDNGLYKSSKREHEEGFWKFVKMDIKQLRLYLKTMLLK